MRSLNSKAGAILWTPRWLFRAVGSHFKLRFVADMAACSQSRLCREWYGLDNGKDAFSTAWPRATTSNEALWCNPPWGPSGAIGHWLERTVDQVRAGCAPVCLFLPADTSTEWWHRWIPYASVVCLKPRISCFDPREQVEVPGAPIGNCLVFVNDYTVSQRTLGKDVLPWSLLDLGEHRPSPRTRRALDTARLHRSTP